MNQREKQKIEKRERILQAAAGVFSQTGYARTLIADIAREAGVGKGTVYEYFRSKEDLFFEVCEWFMEKSLTEASVDMAALSGSVSKRLVRMNDSVLQSVRKMQPLYGLSLEFWSASATSAMRDRFKVLFQDLYNSYRQVIAALIQDGIDYGEFDHAVRPQAMASAIIGTWDSLGLQAWFDPEFDLEQVGRAFIAVVIRGLKPSSNKEPL